MLVYRHGQIFKCRVKAPNVLTGGEGEQGEKQCHASTRPQPPEARTLRMGEVLYWGAFLPSFFLET